MVISSLITYIEYTTDKSLWLVPKLMFQLRHQDAQMIGQMKDAQMKGPPSKD